MRFHGTSPLTPAIVRDRLSAMPAARLTSWASVHVLAASIGTLYCHVDGNHFSVSETGGTTGFGLIGVGEIHEHGAGSALQLRFTLGALPLVCLPAAFLVSIALVGTAFLVGGEVARAASAVVALALGVLWLGTWLRIRWTLGELTRTIGEVDFSRAPGG